MILLYQRKARADGFAPTDPRKLTAIFTYLFTRAHYPNLRLESVLHCKDTIPKIRNKYSQKRNCAATFPIPTFKFLWAIYKFPWSVCLLCCRKIGGLNVGIYRSLTDTWMWKLGLRPRNSFSGNTEIQISLQCMHAKVSAFIQDHTTEYEHMMELRAETL